MTILGYCKECGTAIGPTNLIEGTENVFECPKCFHLNSKDELWDEVPYYLIRKDD